MSGNVGSREPCGLSYQELSKLHDDAVMAHLVAGHGDAAGVLLDRYSRLVLAIARKIVRDSSEAEDVAQEVFLDLYRTAAQFDPAKGTAKMWIVRTAYRRSLTRRRYLRLREAHLQPGLEDAGALNVSSSTDPPFAAKLSSYESDRLVRQILATLDAPQRKVLESVFFHGLTLRDVAEKTGNSYESVRHRYYRGINKLRRLMGGDRMPGRLHTREEAIDAEA